MRPLDNGQSPDVLQKPKRDVYLRPTEAQKFLHRTSLFGGHFHNLSLEYFSPCLGFLCLSTLLSWHWSCPKGLSSLTPSTPPQTLDHFSLPLPNLAGTEPRGWILSKNCQGHGIPASRSAVLTSPHSCSGWTSTATTLLPQGTLPKAFHSCSFFFKVEPAF